MITKTTSINDLFNMAKISLSDVECGEIFLVKDLFRGFEWNRIPRGDRTKLGSRFNDFAKYEASHIIEPLGKTAQNQQQYKKIADL